MPEGPEIRREADRIARVLVDRKVVAAEFPFKKLRRYQSRISGATVTSVDTRGKAMLTRFDNGLTLYSHNQLYGRWFTAPRGQLPDTRRSLRVALHTATHSALLYSASDIEVLSARQLRQHPFLNRIGPDILDPETTSEKMLLRLDEARFRRRSTGALFLDQAFIAGVGNYLRSEILFRSRIHPARRPVDLDYATRRRLARQTRLIGKRAYATGGITTPRELVRQLKSRGMDYDQYRFWVFGRQGLPCYECGNDIARINIAGRRLYLCPACQNAAR